MTDGFGARLRREREQRNISLESIAAATKIKRTLFEALERDDASKWPSGIFRRSFIRSYAKAVGLDPEAVVRDFAECFPDPAEPRVVRSSPPRPLARTEFRLQLADGEASPARRRVVDGTLRRCAVVLCDAALLSGIAIGAFRVFGTFWMPAAIAMVAYYWGGLMLFGHTAGARVVGAILRRRTRTEWTRERPSVNALELADAQPRPSFATSTTTTAG